MMEWMSRILVGGMAGAGEDFGWEVWQIWLIFGKAPTALLIQLSMIHMDQMILSEPLFNCHHLDISGHDGMDEQDIGCRNGCHRPLSLL
jgi:hypothetical protein